MRTPFIAIFFFMPIAAQANNVQLTDIAVANNATAIQRCR
jgi:hypothetical protein